METPPSSAAHAHPLPLAHRSIAQLPLAAAHPLIDFLRAKLRCSRTRSVRGAPACFFLRAERRAPGRQ
jgi:hypothetical protein